MEEAIRNFPKQFAWEPKIANFEKWKALGKYILCGMGGSHLPGDIFQNVVPGFDLTVHQDYGLPRWRDDVLRRTLIIVSSYSGNTEEALSSFEEALKNGYPIAAISTGGDLLIRANQHGVPYIEIPDTDIQPRSALGFTFKALAKMVGRDDVAEEATVVGEQLAETAGMFEQRGRELAVMLRGKVPIIYASNKNYSIAYNWKIRFNETAKIPAFFNTFPELNHNEMSAFDATDPTKELCDKFHFIFLVDTVDHVRIRRRMDILEQQLVERGFEVEIVSLGVGSMLDKIFSSILTADWAAFYTAKMYDRDPEQVPMIEEFKKLIG
ncbi:MAG: bifunctional phosphoglucose/phosphomannose isomerase [Candidatus Wildermuthbacteria bacterium RIFCSPLOWO2_02_FULL_47_9c]|uniref:Bifunctional phosphoglucose/phosphomannose isomerase n=2 Tax=Parcubacteria group TaxID=1794811 RepID=A0A837INN8_9BACT|nr:MAG: Bifunctional phosphoglucose/phosphomannose isomerase [Candidatus Yanofskybacteria bacterium GW2011_GWC1_48_11]KKW04486.1 MAG: Bifunctional phosphoglucose/phosphomannose isomerase [Parcubacteria group bacterium GW2011_GWB1_49_12]KKW09257.1 MAG: Bifunctional phosphoglucose/phosphomannose isomerase [Parcubacteria group bacterium GW2011_GWA1_49_26]KKW14104.1 MAG: Bifunctional phosphoglucose/phosphomannose isomerase [Parcubacteria group bacterium GW2011_GWA2_50_10]OHA61506.1 MAG: bifunctiona